MKVIILAAGEGKRLKPWTNQFPKSLLKIDYHPILDWQLDILRYFDVEEIIIVGGHGFNHLENFIMTILEFV